LPALTRKTLGAHRPTTAGGAAKGVFKLESAAKPGASKLGNVFGALEAKTKTEETKKVTVEDDIDPLVCAVPFPSLRPAPRLNRPCDGCFPLF
jgi:hypothetical protein